jgi:uncharacterized protein
MTLKDTQSHLSALRWLLLSPPLLVDAALAPFDQVSFDPQEQASIDRWLNQHASDPTLAAQLLDAVAASVNLPPAHQRLGKYAEKLLEYFLRNAPVELGIEYLASGVQLQSNESDPNQKPRTIGELDFLLRRKGQLQHWEMATKFYLCDSQQSEPSLGEYVGPNRADSLDRKRMSLTNHQLTRTVPQPWSTIDLQSDLQRDWQRCALFKGWLFQRWATTSERHPHINPSHGAGMWIAHADCAQLHGRYTPLSRLEWLTAKTASLEAYSPYEMLQLAISKPTFFVCVDEIDTAASRLFVVPQTWIDEPPG